MLSKRHWSIKNSCTDVLNPKNIYIYVYNIPRFLLLIEVVIVMRVLTNDVPGGTSARISDKLNRHRQRKNIIKQKIAYRSKIKNSDHKKRS